MVLPGMYTKGMPMAMFHDEWGKQRVRCYPLLFDGSKHGQNKNKHIDIYHIDMQLDEPRTMHHALHSQTILNGSILLTLHSV